MGDQPDRVTGHHETMGVKIVVKVGVWGIPDATAGEIKVPGQERPLVRLPGVAIDVPVLRVHIDVPDHGVGGQQVDALRNVDVVVEVVDARGSTQGEIVDEGLQVGVVLELAVLFLEAAVGGADQPVAVGLVEGAILVEPGPLEVDVVPVLHKIRGAEEGPVLLDADGEGKVGGDTRLAHDLVGNRVADLGLVRPVGEQIDIGHARDIGIEAPLESLGLVEVDVVALLDEAAGRLTVTTEVHVVVELTEVVERADGPARIVGRARTRHEPLHHRKVGLDRRVVTDSAEVLV